MSPCVHIALGCFHCAFTYRCHHVFTQCLGCFHCAFTHNSMPTTRVIQYAAQHEFRNQPLKQCIHLFSNKPHLLSSSHLSASLSLRSLCSNHNVPFSPLRTRLFHTTDPDTSPQHSGPAQHLPISHTPTLTLAHNIQDQLSACLFHTH